MSDPPVTPFVHCPVRSPYDVEPCDPEEIAPLLRHLAEDRPVADTLTFPRGTLLADGRLDLCKQSLGPSGCRSVTEALSETTRVRSLLMGTDGIGDAGAADVADLICRNSRLEIVYLGCNRISGEGATRLCEALGENRSVTGLWLKRNPIGPEGASAVARMLRRNRAVRVLDLVNTGIGADGLLEVLDALIEENRTLERLYLGGNEIESGVASERLAHLLRSNPSIRALLLNVNFLGDSGAIHLAEALRENRTLEEMGLASCGISAVGAGAMFDALKEQPSLEALDLGYSASTRVLGASANALGDVGARAAAAFLQADPPLRKLNLRSTGIGPVGRDAIAVALQSNTRLTELFIDGPSDPAIAAALQTNREARPEERQRPDDVTLIRSVYRTVRRNRREG